MPGSPPPRPWSSWVRTVGVSRQDTESQPATQTRGAADRRSGPVLNRVRQPARRRGDLPRSPSRAAPRPDPTTRSVLRDVPRNRGKMPLGITSWTVWVSALAQSAPAVFGPVPKVTSPSPCVTICWPCVPRWPQRRSPGPRSWSCDCGGRATNERGIRRQPHHPGLVNAHITQLPVGATLVPPTVSWVQGRGLVGLAAESLWAA